jgi:hypothetical protein
MISVKKGVQIGLQSLELVMELRVFHLVGVKRGNFGFLGRLTIPSPLLSGGKTPTTSLLS